MCAYGPERHYAGRIGWLRAAVLGANDGIVSTASLVVGVAAAEAGRSNVLVAEQLMAHDALSAHARYELGLSPTHAARPVQAALASSATFAIGATLPLLMVLISPPAMIIPFVGGGVHWCFWQSWELWPPGLAVHILLAVPVAWRFGERWPWP